MRLCAGKEDGAVVDEELPRRGGEEPQGSVRRRSRWQVWGWLEPFAIGLLALVLNLAGNGQTGLWDRDEPRYAVCVREMRARLREDDSEPPAPDGPFSYYSRFRHGGQHRIYCRRPRAGGKETLLLDGDARAAANAFFHLGGDSLSAMRAVAAINTALDTNLAVTTIFDAPSVRSLSRQVDRQRPANDR